MFGKAVQDALKTADEFISGEGLKDWVKGRGVLGCGLLVGMGRPPLPRPLTHRR